MKKAIILILIFIFVGFWFSTRKGGMNGNSNNIDHTNFKNITYVVDGEPIALNGGHSETTIPNSSSKIVTDYFGNDAEGDLNNDGTKDVAFLLTQNSGGSGTFFYVAVAIKNGKEYIGTNAIFLGDRIAPQNTEIRDGRVIVNFAERKSNDPMTANPEIGVSKFFRLENNTLVEISS